MTKVDLSTDVVTMKRDVVGDGWMETCPSCSRRCETHWEQVFKKVEGGFRMEGRRYRAIECECGYEGRPKRRASEKR